MSLKDLMAQVQKTYGNDAVMLYDSGTALDVQAIPTGSIALDIATGIGGVPEGRIIEIYGPESSGKTTLALHIVREAQMKHEDRACGFIDMEHALDPQYCEDIGIDMSRLVLAQPTNGEEALSLAETFVISNEVSCIVVDSVSALVTKAELEGELEDHHYAPQAKLMSKALRRLTGYAKKHNVTIIFINQVRQKIGVMFGNPETTTGGDALKFYASMRMRTSSSKIKGKGEDEIIVTRVKVEKNKVAPPFKVAYFQIRFGYGIDDLQEIFEFAQAFEIITKNGNFYTIEGNKCQGTDKAIEFLYEQDGSRGNIYRAVMQAIEDNPERAHEHLKERAKKKGK